MRASELTLGSWVIATNNGVCPLPDKIAKMLPRAGRIVNLDYDFVVLDFVDFGFMLDAIEPVPLTAGILEKNGFSKSRLMGEQRHFTYYLAPSVSLLAIYDADFSLCIGDCARYIKYVHQLQHVLCLCGIEKEVQP